RILLDFTYPKTTPAGTALEGISAVEIWESQQPAPREGAPPALDQRVFNSSAKVVQTLREADVAAATFGDRLILALPLPESLEDPARARYYTVRTVGKLEADRSEPSNQVALVPKAPPASPGTVAAVAQPEGISVEWAPVEGALGYNIYRRGAQERAYGPPVQTVGADVRNWVDTTARFGQGYIYAVTSILVPAPLVESAIASEQEVRYADRFPPPVPEDVVALAESGRVRLVWRSSDVEDMAGYHVYRRTGDGELARVTQQPVTTSEYIDTTVTSGQAYGYRVTAVDQSGNESAPGQEVRARVP
ncbi:MAG TPA: hypothetical protein VJ885_09625, partial [Thermoanaerobaculia bacterium]|nr:hypothetical protein [Thermoanaerobaculia bacterium]